MVKLRRKTNVEEISAASMSDLAFLLLVFFMVASVFYVKEGILANLPKKDSSPQMVERDKVVTVKIVGDSVEMDNTSFGTKRFPSLRGFGEELEKLEIPEIKEKFAVISARDTNVQNLVTVLSEVKKRGFLKISMQNFVE
ncbi:MAG: biopolymer transporter ExbD [Leptospiraceae bacterium]|nr:biopolymer transporter ExbD [Leptospiraceae bacterium]